jgi:predicted RNase H-like HicB family nuclease
VDVVVTLHVRTEADGTFWAEAVGLPGCFAAGTTRAELLDAAREAVSQYLDRPRELDVTLVPAGATPPDADVEQVTLTIRDLTLG